MHKNTAIISSTLAFSIILEWFVRKGAVILYGSNGFSLWPWIDNIMHFAWGFNIFLIFFLLLKCEPLDALLAVFAWQMFWETTEMLGDILLSQPHFMLDHFFFDGIKDTFANLVGALLAWWLLASPIKVGKSGPYRQFMLDYAVTSIMLCIIGISYAVYCLATGTVFESPDLLAIVWLIVTALSLGAYECAAYYMKRKKKTRARH